MTKSLPHIAIGQLVEGGYFAGFVNIGTETYGLVVGPKLECDLEDRQWQKNYIDVADAKSFSDGLANTRAMEKAGSELAADVLALSAHGRKDWYLPSLDELELCYRAFKPTTEANSMWARSGINPSSVPRRDPYSHDPVVLTTVEAFRAGGTEAFEPEFYWSSTQHADGSDFAWGQGFDDGAQDDWVKGDDYRARAVRRFSI